MIRRTSILALALAAGVACSDESADTGSEGSASTTSNLLDSRTDPGLGNGSSVPVAGSPAFSQGSAPPSTIARPRQEYDLASLGYDEGEAGAPVRIVEFSDFGCGYCRTFHLESYPELVRDYMSTGKVEWKYVPIIIGLFRNAMPAAEAGICAGDQGRFAEMRDYLFEKQPEWKNADDPEPMMYQYAQDLELDEEAFDSCMSRDETMDRIAAGTQLSQQAGVRGTPTFFIVGYQPIPGALPLETFRMVLDTVYAESTGGGRP